MNINGIGTHIKVKDFERSKAFYKALGFRQVFAYGPTRIVKEDYNGVVFEHHGCKLEIAEGHRAVNPEVFQEQVRSSKISLMIFVDSLEGILARCRKAKIPIAVGPRHFYWGTLELIVKDPDGVVLVFIAPYDRKQAQRIHADETWASAG